MLNKSFTARLIRSPKPGGWTYVIWFKSAAFFGTRGLVKVKATIDGFPFQSSFMALGDGNHKLPVKAEVLQAIGKAPGDTIRITLLERIDPVRNPKKRDLSPKMLTNNRFRTDARQQWAKPGASTP